MTTINWAERFGIPTQNPIPGQPTETEIVGRLPAKGVDASIPAEAGARVISNARYDPLRVEIDNTKSELVFQDEPRRVFLMIQNKSINNVLVAFGAKANATGAVFEIVAGGTQPFEPAPVNSISIIGTVATKQSVVFIQGIQ